MELAFRLARRDDLPALLALLADDVLGRGREAPAAALLPDYLAAFEAIASDPNNELLVAEADARVIGMLQLTYIPGLSRGGSWRALVEAVRISGDMRGHGAGTQLMQHAIARARERGCRLVQLTTDKQRQDAHRFYLRLGFVASHEGMKLPLPQGPV
jgi:GNAT superfamily N-acetyltransferase